MTPTQIFSYYARRAGLSFGINFFNGIGRVQLGQSPVQVILQSLEQADFEANENFEVWERELTFLKSIGAKFCCPVDPDYPRMLLATPEPPIFLSYFGNPIWNLWPTISIVGTREPNQDALIWMENALVPLLKENEIAIVSGAARGIDIQAHRIALRCRRPTVALLPCGLSNIYPHSFEKMIDEVVSLGGAVLSEYSPQARMQKVFFHERNRLISGLSEVLLVVQAKIKSGSLITAQHALRQSRTVAVVPWSPLDPFSSGTNQLLHDGANVVRDHLDLQVLVNISSSTPA